MFYKLPFNELNTEEKAQLEIAHKVIAEGNSLYGENLDHINYVLSYVIHLLNQSFEKEGNAVALIEIKRDEKGYGIALLNAREQDVS